MLVDAAGGQPRLRSALGKRIADNPQWRRRFLASAARLAPQRAGGFENLLRVLAASQEPPRLDEVMPFIRRLIANGDQARARRVWELVRGTELVANGEFERQSRSNAAVSLLSWHAVEGPDVRVDAGEPSPKRNGSAVRIYAAGVGVIVLSQSLMLNPGRYRLAYWLLPDRKELPSASWEIRCSGGVRIAAAAAGAEPATAGPWRHFTSVFDVPPRDCPFQDLRLRWTKGRAHGNSGWIDGVELNRLAQN
jgi:hypothetical protein